MGLRRAGGAWLQRAPLAVAAGEPHALCPPALKHCHLLKKSVIIQK